MAVGGVGSGSGNANAAAQAAAEAQRRAEEARQRAEAAARAREQAAQQAQQAAQQAEAQAKHAQQVQSAAQKLSESLKAHKPQEVEDAGKKIAEQLTDDAARKGGEEAGRLIAEEAARQAGKDAGKLIAEEAARQAGKGAGKLIADEALRKTGEGAGKLIADEALRKTGEGAGRLIAEEAARKGGEAIGRETRSEAVRRGAEKIGEHLGLRLGGAKIGRELAGKAIESGAKELARLGNVDEYARDIGESFAQDAIRHAGEQIGGKKLAEVAENVAKEALTQGIRRAAENAGAHSLEAAELKNAAEKAGHEAGENFREALGRNAPGVLLDKTFKSELQSGVESLLRKGVDKASQAATLPDEPKNAKDLGRKEARELVDSAADQAEQELGKPLSEASPAEADRALQKALDERAADANVDPKSLKKLEGKDSEGEKSREFASAFADEAKSRLQDRLGKDNAALVLSGSGGRALEKAVGDQVKRGVREAFGMDAARKAEEVALKGAEFKASPEKKAELAQERLDSYRADLAAKYPDGDGRENTDLRRAELAHALEREVENLPKSERNAFVGANRDIVSDITAGAQGTPEEGQRKDILESLSQIAEATGPEGAKVLAQEFVKNGVNQHTDVGNGDQLGGALKSVIKGGAGTTFAASVIEELKGKPEFEELRGNVMQATSEAMSELRSEFEDKHEEFQQAEARLNEYVEGFGNTLTPAQMENAIARFKKDNPEYAEFEEASEKYSNTLGGAGILSQDKDLPDDLSTEADKAITHTDELSQSAAGSKKITEALQEDADGTPDSFLQQAKTVAEDVYGVGSKAKGFLDSLANAVSSSVSKEAFRLAGDGKVAEAKLVLRGLSTQTGIFRSNPKNLEKGVKTLETILDGSPAEQKEALKSLKSQAKSEAFGGPDSVASNSFKALGIAFFAIGAKEGFEDAKNGGIDKKVKFAADALGAGADAASLATGFISNGADDLDKAGKLSKVFGKVSGPLAVVSGLVDGFNGIKALTEGNIKEAAPDLANAVGTGLLLAPHPLAKVAGALILGVNGLVGLFKDKKDPLAEEQAKNEEGLKSFLQGAGFEEPVAEKLSQLKRYEYKEYEVSTDPAGFQNQYEVDKYRYLNMGPFLDAVRSHSGTSREDLVRRLNNATPEQLDTLVSSFESTPISAGPMGEPFWDDSNPRQAYPGGAGSSIEVASYKLYEAGILPYPSTYERQRQQRD